MEVDDGMVDDTTTAKSIENGNDKEECRFDQWVDYLPHHRHLNNSNDKKDNDEEEVENNALLVKRASLDVTESHLTSDDSSVMDTENWPDSASLEDYAMVPNALLVEHDPLLQHELLLTDPSIHKMLVSEQFTASLQDVLEERRRVLMASMEASQRTRRCLEPHIKQRASLACVLSDIEGSSKTLREHVLQEQEQTQQNSIMDDVVVHMEEDEEEMLASALDLEEEPPLPPTTTTTTH